ncbi:hypothetical protein AgCh_004875 [Apium graveolens]
MLFDDENDLIIVDMRKITENVEEDIKDDHPIEQELDLQEEINNEVNRLEQVNGPAAKAKITLKVVIFVTGAKVSKKSNPSEEMKRNQGNLKYSEIQMMNQSIVSRSSIEAEYRALADVYYEISWLTTLCQELHTPSLTPASLCCDNKSAL